MKRGRLVLVKQDDETTLFECPDCGQRGSVPTPVLQNALSETDDVRISCTNCPTKFSPLATYTATAEEATNNGESDNGESDDAIIDALKANWQAADAAILKNNETAAAQDENENDGALPAWLRPPEKKSEPTKSATTEPQEDISANDEADDEASNISTNDDQDAGDDISDVLTDDNEPVAIAEAEDEPLEISDSAPPQMPAPQTASYQTEVEVEPKIQPEAPSPAFAQAPEETPQTSQDALTQWDDVDEEEFEEYSQDGDVHRQPVDLLNAVQLILLTIVALLFAFSGFILLTSI